MITLSHHQLLIDGQPRVLIAGEVHYFRLPVERWDTTLDLAVQAGCNTIATYLPWHMHEEIEGHIDWTGRTRPHLNLVLFLEKVAARGLMVFLRPGPFIMAEMKNEGLPYWLLKKYPEIIPTTWDHQPVSTYTVDYLHPAFLQATQRYYASLFPHIQRFLHQNGGPIVTIQLDNEIGMLSWVSNSPDLTPTVLVGFRQFLSTLYGENLLTRYPYFEHVETFNQHIISPTDDAVQVHYDLGLYMRRRFKQFADELRHMFEQLGVQDIPYVINIHGTSDGRALLYPIGLSQLLEAFDEPNHLGGSDLYLEDFHMGSFHDFYIVNGMQASLNTHGQPLATVEFNCGDGNFGDDLGIRMDPASTDLKTRICIAQGHKVINYYLLSGGTNDRLFVAPHDGNDRIAITGQRHGFAAPINPEGLPNTSFGRLSEVNTTVLTHESILANMLPCYDAIAMGWMPDYFMTESAYPGSESVKAIYKNLKTHRAGNMWNVVTKLLLLRTINPKVVNLQSATYDLHQHPVLYVESARYMASDVQRRLLSYVQHGGKLFLGGEFPIADLLGQPCTLLVDGLGIQPHDIVYDQHHLYLSVAPVGSLAHHPETRVYYAQPFSGAKVAPLATIYHTHQMVAGHVQVGLGEAILWMSPLPGHIHLLDDLLHLLDYQGTLRHDYAAHGIVVIPTTHSTESLYHLINVDNFEKTFALTIDNHALFGGHHLHLPAKRGLILAHGVTTNIGRIQWSTLELSAIQATRLSFRAHPGDHQIQLETTHDLVCSLPVMMTRVDHIVTLSFHCNSDHLEFTVSRA